MVAGVLMARLPKLWRWIIGAAVVISLVGGALLLARRSARVGPVIYAPAAMAEREAKARARFLREHPGEQPLNVAIARAAVEFYKTRPMGKFILGIGPDDIGNDCSDFAKSAVDEGLGLRARFKRGSDRHLIGDDLRYQYEFAWDHASDLLPGDTLIVEHSPWYEPHPDTCRHVGVIGTDGYVYDFVKLKVWKEARYGRHALAWFVRNSPGPAQVWVRRLLPEYRYRLARLRITAR
jgi:hypothetical protein